LLAGIDDFFNHFAELIDLDRKNAAILAFVVVLRDRVLKREVNRFNPMTKQILEPDDERKTQAARARFAYHFENINAAAGLLERCGDHVAFSVDRKISTAPTIDIVSSDGGVNVPLVLHFSSAPKSEAIGIITDSSQHASQLRKNLSGKLFLLFRAACFSGPHG